MPVARWTANAVDLSETPEKVSEYFGILAVCARTGLAESTVRDSMLRDPITDSDNPRGAICRPAARIGGLMAPTPLWAGYQLDEYDRRVRRRTEARATPARLDLPRIEPDEARRRGLASIDRIADQIGCAVNTLRRFARDYRATFPAEEAISSSSQGPTPLGYRNVADVAAWVTQHEQGSADRGDDRGDKEPVALAAAAGVSVATAD